MTYFQTVNDEQKSVFTAAGAIAAAFVAATACVGPLLGIALGVAGLGWLSQFSYLTVPASVLSIVLVATALYLFKARRSSCVSRKRHRQNQAFLGLAVVIVALINIVEYLVIPGLA